eukprot:3581285-Prymnesium_polylepis.1
MKLVQQLLLLDGQKLLSSNHPYNVAILVVNPKNPRGRRGRLIRLAARFVQGVLVLLQPGVRNLH